MNLFLFIDDKDLSIFLNRPKSYNDTIFSLKRYFSKFTIVNISKIIGEEINNKHFKKILDKENIDYFCPSYPSELINKINKNNNYGFFKAKFDLKYYKILRTLNKSNIKLIQVSNYSFIFEKNSFRARTINDNLRVIFKIRLMNYFHRIMCALNLYPKVHIHFDCDQNRIDLINSSLSKKIDNFIPIINLSYYKKIVRINSKYYSDFIKLKKNKIEKKFITLSDQPLAHPDFTAREGLIDYKKKDIYYKNLISLLKKIEKTFNKKVVICLHPKAEYNNFKSFKLLKKNFKTVYYKTEYYISKSFLVLNGISSTMNYAIIQNKPIFIIKSRYFGNTVKNKIKNIKKELNYPIINVDNFDQYNFKKLLDIKNKKKIELYKKNRLYFELDTTYLKQVINYLKEKH
jgi:hypothetical protein